VIDPADEARRDYQELLRKEAYWKQKRARGSRPYKQVAARGRSPFIEVYRSLADLQKFNRAYHTGHELIGQIGRLIEEPQPRD
jgi:hypothetical protein